MLSLQFWKSWPVVYRRLGFILTMTFGVAIISMWVSYWQSPAPSISFFHIQELESEEIPVHSFQQGPFELTITGDNYLIFEKLLGDDLKPNVLAGYLFIALLTIGLVTGLTLITTLSRFWYLLCMGLFILFVVSLRLEIVQLFGWSNKLFPIGTLVIYVLASIYFQMVNVSTSFAKRFIVFLLISLLLALVVVFFSEVKFPVLHIAVNGIVAAIVITILFIISVAHEILASFVYVASQGIKQGKSLNHFLIISTIYMLNLALAYAHKINYIDWDFMYVDLILLITISGILGVWGFRLREPQYEKIIQADPFGVYFYLAFATIAFAAIGYFIGTANDPALQTIYDAIIYSHLGFGIIFLTYVISNFIVMLANNMPVHKVLYKPNRMPYFTFRFGGIIATLAFVFYNTWQVPVNNAYGGYYNARADIYLATGETKLAEAFYRTAGRAGFLNHHSNYALANIEERKYNIFEARSYYERASQRRPTEQSFLNLSDLYERGRQNLKALLILQEANQRFPESGAVKNTLALLFSKLNILDSAIHFLQFAESYSISEVMANANLMGLVAKNHLPLDVDSLFQLIHSDNPGIQSNALALANTQQSKMDINIEFGRDPTLNLFSSTRLNNYILNNLGQIDSAMMERTLQISSRAQNQNFKESLLFVCTLSLYEEGKVGKAFDLLEEVTIDAYDKGKYNNILAMWALEQNAPEVALEYLRYASQQDFKEAGITSAIAHSEAHHWNAINLWDSVRNSDIDSLSKVSAETMIKIHSVNPARTQQLDDYEKYLYCRYRIQPLDTIQLKQLANQITNPDLKASAYLDKSVQLFELDQLEVAISMYQNLGGLQINRHLYERAANLELRMLAKKGDLRLLAQKINEGSIDFENHRTDKIYFTALLNEFARDTLQASLNYNRLASRNPFDEDAIIAAANYFRAHSTNSLRAYDILAEALLENPYSVKLLKAYALEAIRNGFEQYTLSAIERLQALLPPLVMQKFFKDNQTVLTPVLQ